MKNNCMILLFGRDIKTVITGAWLLPHVGLVIAAVFVFSVSAKNNSCLCKTLFQIMF